MTMKEKLQKLFAMILILGIALSLEVPVLAADKAPDNEQGMITIHQFNVNDFDNLKQGDGTTISNEELPEQRAAVEGVAYVIERLEGTITSQEEAEKASGTYVAEGKTDKSGMLVFDHLPKGYYKITQKVEENTLAQSASFYVALPTILEDKSENFDIHVYPKTETQKIITMERSGEKQVLGIGDTASWTIHCYFAKDILKNSKAQSSHLIEMWVKDVMDPRMDYEKAKTRMSVYDRAGNQIPGVTLVEGEDYIETYDAQKREVQWNYQPSGIGKIQEYHVAEVRIDVQMSINDSIVGTQENLWNEAYIHMQTAEGRILSSEVFDLNEDKNAVGVPKAYVGSISVYEKDEDNGKILIQGASLKLAKSKEEALAGQFIQVSAEHLDARPELLEKLLSVVHAQELSSKVDFEVHTGEDGAATFEGLGSGDYWLVEADMPEEYSENEEPIKVTVGDTQEDAHAEVILEHKKVNSQQPSSESTADKGITATVKTGDHTDVWPWCGAVLIALGAILICSRRNRKETEIYDEKK